MYFRTKKTPSGIVLQLVESFRDQEGRPRQRIVISLGDAAIAPDQQPLVARAVQHILSGSDDLGLIDDSPVVREWAQVVVRRVRAQAMAKIQSPGDQPVVVDAVLIDQVTHSEAVVLGPSLLALDAWRRLEMDQCLQGLGFNNSQILAAQINVINRLTDPVSENALPDWAAHTALPELLGEQSLRCPKDRFYRVSDKLLEKRKDIEQHLRNRQMELFGFKRTIVLYDLTNTYFEGKALINAKAKRGKSKEKRDDCPQVVVAMAFDEYGFELAHEVFAGATSDSKTLLVMLDRLEESFSSKEVFDELKPLVIMDGGVATQANRKLLRERGYGYIVNETRMGRAKWAEQFKQNEQFHEVTGRDKKAAVRVRVVHEHADGNGERVLLCKSDGRREKEQAIRSQAETRMLSGLADLEKRVSSGKLKDIAKIERAIGTLQSKHSRAARFYEITLQSQPRPQLTWKERTESRQEADELLGCYVLRTEANDFNAQQIWEVYMTLSKAEDGFQSLKSDLGLRPIRHQKEGRCDGHVLICVLAYHLLRQIMYRLEQSDDFRSWETIRRIMQTHVYATITVPTVDDGTYRIRRAGQPDALQQSIYETLGIDWKSLPHNREHLGANQETL